MPDEPIYFWEYQLHSQAALNSASVRRSFPGALIRRGAGVGCLHPWPEFGDAPLDAQLQSLQAGTPTPLAQLALEAAAIDGAARENGVSLFEGLEIPASHYSWSFGHASGPQIRRLLTEGWPALKAKGFAHWGETRRFLEACEQATRGSGLRFRVDFNGCLTPPEFHQFIEFMPLRLYRALDFIEDPYPYDATAWMDSRQRWQVRLALDKGWRDGTDGFDCVVVKPARRDWREVVARHPDRSLILTSAMDHPIGQLYAAYQAALARAELGEQVGLCGLCTEHLFTGDPFLERVRSPGGRLEFDRSGGGLGMGDLIEKLPWRRLT